MDTGKVSGIDWESRHMPDWYFIVHELPRKKSGEFPLSSNACGRPFLYYRPPAPVQEPEYRIFGHVASMSSGSRLDQFWGFQIPDRC
jgi:hypothetical protein